MSQRSTVADWAPHVGVSIFTRVFSAIRSTWMMTVSDGPFAWKLGIQGKNEFDDIEGPFYIVGSPKRQYQDGKAVLSSVELLNKNDPFLFILDVKDTKGDPVPNATVDLWQANSEGSYYFSTWTLRGKATTDAQGRLEIMTVRPGEYVGRAGHIHMRISGTKGKHVTMTTQMYICIGNDPGQLSSDVANYYRARPDRNVATCWTVMDARDGKSYRELPRLPAEETKLAEKVSWWNERLKEHGVTREIQSIGRHQIKLTAH